MFPISSSWKSHTVSAEQIAALESAIDALGVSIPCESTRSTVTRITAQGRQVWGCESPPSQPQQGGALTPLEEVFSLLFALESDRSARDDRQA